MKIKFCLGVLQKWFVFPYLKPCEIWRAAAHYNAATTNIPQNYLFLEKQYAAVMFHTL